VETYSSPEADASAEAFHRADIAGAAVGAAYQLYIDQIAELRGEPVDEAEVSRRPGYDRALGRVERIWAEARALARRPRSAAGSRICRPGRPAA
jgi:hypothetical protein